MRTNIDYHIAGNFRRSNFRKFRKYFFETLAIVYDHVQFHGS